MVYSKIDATLASALKTGQGGGDAFVVFIHTTQPLGPAEAAILAKHGVAVGPGMVFTATLSRQAIEELSGQSWVRALRLSAKLRPLQHC